MFNNISEKKEMQRKFNILFGKKDIKGIEKMILEFPDLDINAEIMTACPIILSAQQENWEMFKLLFEHNANVDVKIVPYNWYLIHECVVNAPKNIAEAVIEHTNINSQTSKGETPLMVAIKNEKFEMAEYMLDTERLELTLKDYNGNNALHYAAEIGNHDLFLKIMKKSKNLIKENKKGLNPIDLIEDELFKANFPNVVITKQISNNEIVHSINLKIEKVEEKIKEEKISKIKGLSVIKKR